MNKPNQIVDPYLNVIYPPPEAIVGQLNTIKSLAASTIRMYEETQEIRTIQTNLNALVSCIDYLRGAPAPDPLPIPPEDTLHPVFDFGNNGVTAIVNFNDEGQYDVSVVALDADKEIIHPELFGDIDFDALEMNISIPVTCGKTYLISQNNPILKHYKDDPSVTKFEPVDWDDDVEWIKEKTYMMDEDEFTYAFLLGKGRSKVTISIFADYEEPITFNITSHIHFKPEVEVPVEPEPEPEPIEPEPEPEEPTE